MDWTGFEDLTLEQARWLVDELGLLRTEDADRVAGRISGAIQVHTPAANVAGPVRKAIEAGEPDQRPGELRAIVQPLYPDRSYAAPDFHPNLTSLRNVLIAELDQPTDHGV